ncbi:MAG: hypothetical protein RBT57_02940 [Paludibacter sp.]|jgi:hypothetical protein|nr:hypothetical protein [Paludibacter sp.]
MAEKRMYVRSIGTVEQSDRERRRKEIELNKELERRLEEIEDWLMDTPFNHPDFQTKVEERNNLLIRIK